MPISANTPKRHVSQAPAKPIECFGGCGITVEFRTNPRVYCPKCKLKRKRASARVAMEKQRRKRGVPLVKGTTTPCDMCERPFERNRNTRAKYCPECAPLHYAELARCGSRAKRETAAGRAYANAYESRRKRVDPAFHLMRKLRARIYAALRREPALKSERTIVLLGCTFGHFKTHIERQFSRGMTWEKIMAGKVHLDHIRPCASFDLTDPEQQRECFHYLNIRPLWADENFAKHAKRTLLL
jgi:hypothetical protein